MKRKIFLSILLNFFIFLNFANSKVIENIIIVGNDRISDETVLMFSQVKIKENINDKKLNLILKNLYGSNFFDNVSVSFKDTTLKIKVVELPIIEKIDFTGIKAKKNLKEIKDIIKLKPRSSFNNFILSEDKKNISIKLRQMGYYFSDVEIFIEDLKDNKVNIKYNINLGKKAKIKKISFIGDKKFKDRKLRSLIISEEYKFWKFISGKKFLSEDIISMDQRLLRNFYLNKGFYNVEINTSFAKLINDDEFELIFNINPNNKVFFNELSIVYPTDFEKNNFRSLESLLNDLKNTQYSINSINEILDEIDLITINEEYQSVQASIEENLVLDKLDIIFKIEETKKYYIEKINIYGNNVTRENVIRNQFEIDEGDPFNEILHKKSVNNIKSLNFFRKVSSEILEGKNENSKIINFNIEEKPTGEITAGAGVGTSGGTVAFGVKENNYLGKGLGVEANATVTGETFKGLFSITNPNFNNSDKLVFFNIQAQEIDQIKNYGYKTNKTGFEVGTNFEYLDNFTLGLSTRSFYEKIETDSTASARQKKQEGDYFDSFAKFYFDYDKRNQKFKTSSGFRSNYTLDLPIISKTNTLTNTYNYKFFTELYENNVSSLGLFFQSANSITGDDVKLSERLNMPSSKLRGFERGKVGPKDGDDFIGGNYISSINFSSTLPQILPNFQNLDVLFFIDAANIWGVDYDSSLSDSNKIRSSIGFGIDWFTVIGPLNFSLSETLSKNDTDITESFRFNIGTTF
tara:strand:- start:818 stop:3058 length:2241 start_codon:yes stop_codon:yes gene_type:complete